MLHPETQVSLDHSSRNEIIEHSICSDYIRSHSGNFSSDQVEFLEGVIIELTHRIWRWRCYPFELSKDEYVFSCEINDGQFYLEKDGIINTCKEEYNPLHSNQFEGDLI